MVAAVLAAAAGGAALIACDLFHSTDFATLCDINSSADACMDAAPSADAAVAPTDFCSWDAATARTNAEHACGWLSACELPLGNNDFGPCMISATLAYDCAANPDRKVQGALHEYWDGLWQAKTCADVDRAVFPGAGAGDKVPACQGAGFAACGVQYDGGDNSAVRVECDEAGAPARGENCISQGRTCAGGACVGSATTPCATGCSGAQLADCSDAGVDEGTNCALFGSGQCLMLAAGPACSSTGGSPCSAGAAVTCAGGVASGCPSGTSETVDCTELTGSGSCNPGLASPSWDVSSVCFLDGGSCGPDSCSGDTLVSCARGATFVTSCSGLGLGPCGLVVTVDGLRAACGKP
jgi:hypothetical protein